HRRGRAGAGALCGPLPALQLARRVAVRGQAALRDAAAVRRARGASGECRVRVAFGCDHRSVLLRDTVLPELAALGHDVIDLGPNDPTARVDYPDTADVAEAISSGRADRAVLAAAAAPASRSGVQAPGHPRVGLPRRLLGPPGGRARRHERALPRLGDRRRHPRGRARALVRRRVVRRRGWTPETARDACAAGGCDTRLKASTLAPTGLKRRQELGFR